MKLSLLPCGPRHEAQIIWTILRGVVLGEYWLKRNAKVFNPEDWALEQITERSWKGHEGYGRLEWKNITHA
uniref:Uncharacterized protein n=1 Tax=Physcomitrium patens TaxID=3218 RepID=A0A2K1IUZ3_PHYPA|nr:hypothetical protein PHYPA_025040 [Physcomitrium patens]